MKYRLEEHPNGYASLIGGIFQSQDVRFVRPSEGQRLVEVLNQLEDVKYFGGSHPTRHEGVVIDGKRFLLESVVQENLAVQVEAKCKALRQVNDLERQMKLGDSPTNRALKQRLGVRTSQVSRLLTVLERAQDVLAEYIEPNGRVKPRDALTGLLGILDDGGLVTLMRNLRQLIGVKDNGSVELTKEQKTQVLSALDNLAMAYPWVWPLGMRDNYDNACRILGASEDGDVAQKSPQVGDEATVILKRGSDGKQYIAGFGLGIPNSVEPFHVQGGQAYIDGGCIAVERGTAIHEALERVVNNTVNHFAPKPQLTGKQRKALGDCINYFEPLGGPENSAIVKQFRKLLKKLS